MNSEPKKPKHSSPKYSSLNSEWVQDAMQLNQLPAWGRWLAIGMTFGSCFLYLSTFNLISEYQLLVVDQIRDLPIFTRIMLNIYQPFLVVFIIISLSLWILLYINTKRPRGSYKPYMMLIVFNGVFAASLLVVSLFKVS